MSDFKGILVDGTPDALIATSPDGTVLFWNRGAENTFGYPSVEATGRSIYELIIPIDRIDEERAIQNDALRTEVATYESVRRKKDGSLVHINISTRAIRDAQGQVEYFVTNKKDVTHLK